MGKQCSTVQDEVCEDVPSKNCRVVSAGLLMRKNARLFTLKSATLLPDKSVKRFTTLKFVATSGPRSASRCPRRSANKCPRRNALMFRRGNARQWKKKSVKQFPGLSAQKFPTDNVAASLSKSVLISPSSNVSRCLRLSVRI